MFIFLIVTVAFGPFEAEGEKKKQRGLQLQFRSLR